MGYSFLPSLAPELEREFQQSYYDRIRPTLHAMTPLLAVMLVAYAGRDFSDTHSVRLAASENGAPAAFFLLVFALTWVRAFERLWQPIVVGGGLAAALVSLNGMGTFLSSMHPRVIPTGDSFNADALFFGQQVGLLMVCLAVLRLQFKWALALQVGVLSIGTWAFLTRLHPAFVTGNELSRFLQPLAALLVAVLLAAQVEERLAHSAFLANHRLEEERNDEKRKREQTEKMLHVLSQAIGGIVHDLGNPLTTVQMGAQTLEVLLDGDTDKETLREMTGAITSGSQMLNYLRLSLIEQTRVLEGRPTPVDVRPVALRAIVEAGAHFQKPYLRGRRPILIDGEDVRVCADEMKMVTVFMNLIGNALKYSAGEVRATWHEFGTGGKGQDRRLHIAVLDRGTQGKGITQKQASQLFTAFGRLETHASIEGTGLGLLSVQKIVAAQGGETFIEGYVDGTPASPLFSTAPSAGLPMLEGEFRTAFVLTCPLASEA